MSSKPGPVRNLLLAFLPYEVLKHLLPKLRSVTLPVRHHIYHPDSVIESVYFPESGMISLVANLDGGVQAEIGIIGREGMLGVSLLSGINTPFFESMVQMPGTALQMRVADFRQEMESNPHFRMLLMRYSEALQAQVMQTAACNGHHGLEQRLARWLLMAHDRVECDELPLKQEFLAMMLGVHRPAITVTAANLQRAGLISYASGRITVLDRTNLEAASCECYEVVTRRFAAPLGEKVF